MMDLATIHLPRCPSTITMAPSTLLSLSELESPVIGSLFVQPITKKTNVKKRKKGTMVSLGFPEEDVMI